MKKLLIATTICGLALAGCQTRVTWEKYPETQGGGWYVTARSPLFAKEQLRGFSAEVNTNGSLRVEIRSYDRDLSTNSIAMVKTVFDGSANLALAVAKAYATISTGGASDALISRVVDYFKSHGGDPSKSSVTADPSAGKITVADGTTCISCDAAGNCGPCSE